MQLCNIQDTHFLNQISFNPLLLLNIQVFLPTLKLCCFHELHCSRNCFPQDYLMAGLRVYDRGGQGGRARVTCCFMDTSVPLCSISHFLTIAIKLPSHFLPPRLTFSKIPIGFIPLGQTSSLSQTLFAESGNKVQ